MRQTVLFLQAHNIPDADTITLGRMWNTAIQLRAILNKSLASELVGIQAAAMSVMVKEGGKHFANIIKGLTNG